MKPFVRYSAILLALVAASPAFADDQDKANKELAKVAAIAWDGIGRGVVSRAVSDTLGVKRADLVQQRLAMNVNYGSIFLAQELIKSGAKMDDIAAELKAGKKMSQVANDQHANWKQIATDAKKLNAKIDDGLYRHFLNDKADRQRDLDDKYVLENDNVADDHDIAKSDIEAAAERFQMWKDRGFAAQGHNHQLDTAEQQAAYYDHNRNGGPEGVPGQGGNGNVGTQAPAAGGARTGPN
jgi:hypothetical protein